MPGWLIVISSLGSVVFGWVALLKKAANRFGRLYVKKCDKE